MMDDGGGAGGLRLFEVCLRVCGNLIYMCFLHIIILYVITTYKTYCVLEQTRDRPQTDTPPFQGYNLNYTGPASSLADWIGRLTRVPIYPVGLAGGCV